MSPPGAAVKSARERVQTVSAYNELGSYRAAARLCGTTTRRFTGSSSASAPAGWRRRARSARRTPTRSPI